MKKELMSSYIKSSVPFFADSLEVDYSKYRIAIYVKTTFPAKNGSRAYSCKSSVAYFRRLEKNRYHQGLHGGEAGNDEVIDFSDWKSHKKLGKILNSLLHANHKRCQQDFERWSWAFVGLSHEQSMKIRLDKIQEIVKEYQDVPCYERSEYSISFNDSGFKISIYPKSATEVSVEVISEDDEDLIYGDDFQFEPNLPFFSQELTKIAEDPSGYFGIPNE